MPEYIGKEDLKIEQIPIIKNALIITHLFDNPIAKDKKRQMKTDIVNIEEAIIEEDVLQASAENAMLNYMYSVELIKDVRNALIAHKEQLFTKITQFYFHRACFEKNFCNI